MPFESSSPHAQMESVYQMLEVAARSGSHRGIRIWDRRCRHVERRTYQEILESVRTGAARWKQLGVKPGDRVLIGLPNSWAWMDAWFGALALGALPIALAPGGKASGLLQKVESLFDRLGVSKMICDPSLLAGLLKLKEGEPDPQFAERLVSTETFFALQPSGPAEVYVPGSPNETAFLQLTSGSTGWPRAVMISHRAAIHNPLAIADAVSMPQGRPIKEWVEGVVSWLPLNHDMGLIGCLLFSIVHVLELTLLRPDAFLLKPENWLARFAEAKNGKILSPAPNFAYQTCVERITPELAEKLSLTSWAAAMTGAEMVQPKTCAAFCERFAPAGFTPETFQPCYGLAEGTLAVTVDRQGKGARTRPRPRSAQSGWGEKDVVCTGRPVMDTEVSITAPDGTPMPEKQIGQVRAKGPGIFSGYYNDPEATREGLVDGWLCTGDLGFLENGELYLTGRTKDVLIVHGHNMMPHELEWLAESVSGGGGTERCGAFSVSQGVAGEQAVLVVETSERDPAKLADLSHEIKVRIGRALGLPLSEVRFVRRGQIPKTTSGKVQRGALREKYLSGALETLLLE